MNKKVESNTPKSKLENVHLSLVNDEVKIYWCNIIIDDKSDNSWETSSIVKKWTPIIIDNGIIEIKTGVLLCKNWIWILKIDKWMFKDSDDWDYRSINNWIELLYSPDGIDSFFSKWKNVKIKWLEVSHKWMYLDFTPDWIEERPEEKDYSEPIMKLWTKIKYMTYWIILCLGSNGLYDGYNSLSKSVREERNVTLQKLSWFIRKDKQSIWIISKSLYDTLLDNGFSWTNINNATIPIWLIWEEVYKKYWKYYVWNDGKEIKGLKK